MVMLLLVVLLTVALSHGLVEPLAALLRWMFSLSWLGWGLLLLVAWLLAGGEAESSELRRQGGDPPADQG